MVTRPKIEALAACGHDHNNADTREVKVYVNGILQSQGTLRLRSVTIKGNSADRMFLIGKSYDDARWFEGDMAESFVCGMWFVHRRR